jgi:adenylate cyclase
MSHGPGPGDPAAAGGGSPPRLSAAELARRLGVETSWVDRLATAGAIEPGADGSFDAGDVHRVRLLLAFEESGVPLDVLIDASAAGRISLRYYDELHQPPTALTGRTYEAFAASLGERRELLPQLFAAFGIAEPDGDVELSTDDETVLSECLDALDTTGEPDLVLRAIRMFGEGLRRAADAALGIYAEAVSRTGEDLAGLPVDEAFNRVLRPWARFARSSVDLTTWLTRRHMSRAIDDYSIVESERILEARGFLESRRASPPAVAFVDLTGFTRLTQEIGDEAAAALALLLGDVAAETVRPHRGRLVKLLGDGVLVRFADSRSAVLATLDLLDALPPAGLPSGHAGIASGPLIARDGDIFGRTVNLAARIADAAPDGHLWVTEAVAAGLVAERFVLARTDGATLQGIGRVPLVDVSRATG